MNNTNENRNDFDTINDMAMALVYVCGCGETREEHKQAWATASKLWDQGYRYLPDGILSSPCRYMQEGES